MLELPVIGRRYAIPEGLRVLPDGTWRAGEKAVSHPRSLRYFKARLAFDEGGAFILNGRQRMTVAVDGPPFTVVGVELDGEAGQTRITLDDGTVEVLGSPSFSMNRDTGRVECTARAGRARAVLSHEAQDTLLEHLEHEGGEFFVRVGEKRVPVRP
jgi:hypothetical protein